MRTISDFLLLLTALFLTIPISAQGLSEILFPHKDVTYLGQLSTNGTEKNGMGCLKIKDGSVYVGDFSRGKYHGTGILISSANKPINKCGDAIIYVGRWFRGKKEGRGRLYNSNGELIYEGRFSNDIPIENLNKISESDKVHSFTIINIDNETYVGELLNGYPDGFGIYHDEDGFFTICNSAYGERTGIGIMLLPPTEWGVFNIENERYFPIENSGEQRERNATYKANKEKARMELLNAFSNLLSQSGQLVADIQTYNNRNVTNSNMSVNNDNSSRTSASLNKSDENAPKYDLSEQVNCNSDKATYGRYETMVIQALAGTRDATPKEIGEWQSKMRDLRIKWEKRGKSFPHSTYEN